MLRRVSSNFDYGTYGASLGVRAFAMLALLAASAAACSSSDTPAGAGGTGGTSGTTGKGGKGGSTGVADGGNGATTASCASDVEAGPMVEVEAGDFDMGCNDAIDGDCAADEKPQHTVTLGKFEIDVTEVTQEAYSACVQAGACSPPSCPWDCDKTTYPASCIEWTAASSYCAWAGKRLPTEAEWEKAARGTDGRIYPWGNDKPDCSLTNMAGCGEAAMPVGSLQDGASPFGALDMAGNMVELVADIYDANYYATSPDTDPTGPTSGNRYGGRGGGFKSDATWQRTSKRDWYDLTDQGESLGFRCAR